MEIIISGYGDKTQNTIALYQYEKKSNFHLKWKDAVENASFVCQGENILFTVTESEESAVIYSYREEEGGYRYIDCKQLEGSSLCHITYSAKNKALFGACYGSGTIFSVRVNNGRFEELLHYERQLGKNPGDLTRAHCVLLNKDEKMLVVTNIALDRLYYYSINHGNLSLLKITQLPQGVGPRHIVFSKDEQLIYIITEYSNEILIYQNAEGSNLLQRISTLDQDFKGGSNCSTLCFSSDFRYLYAANRGADTITQFTVKPQGTLEKIAEFSCGGSHPRHMIITKDGECLILCNQFSNRVNVFSLDKKNGAVDKLITSIELEAPSGVLEV